MLACIVGRRLLEHPAINTLADAAGSRPITEAAAVINARGARCNLRGADHLGPLAVARRRQEATTLEPAEAALAIVDMGWAGLDLFIPTVTPPQVAALGLGRIRSAPIKRDRVLSMRPTLSIALAIDTRWINDEPAAYFLADIVQWVEEPYRML